MDKIDGERWQLNAYDALILQLAATLYGTSGGNLDGENLRDKLEWAMGRAANLIVAYKELLAQAEQNEDGEP